MNVRIICLCLAGWLVMGAPATAQLINILGTGATQGAADLGAHGLPAQAGASGQTAVGSQLTPPRFLGETQIQGGAFGSAMFSAPPPRAGFDATGQLDTAARASRGAGSIGVDAAGRTGGEAGLEAARSRGGFSSLDFLGRGEAAARAGAVMTGRRAAGAAGSSAGAESALGGGGLLLRGEGRGETSAGLLGQSNAGAETRGFLNGDGRIESRLQTMQTADPLGFQAFMDAHPGLKWQFQGVRPGERTGWTASHAGEAAANTELDALWHQRAELLSGDASAEQVSAVDARIAAIRSSNAAGPQGLRAASWSEARSRGALQARGSRGALAAAGEGEAVAGVSGEADVGR